MHEPGLGYGSPATSSLVHAGRGAYETAYAGGRHVPVDQAGDQHRHGGKPQRCRHEGGSEPVGEVDHDTLRSESRYARRRPVLRRRAVAHEDQQLSVTGRQKSWSSRLIPPGLWRSPRHDLRCAISRPAPHARTSADKATPTIASPKRTSTASAAAAKPACIAMIPGRIGAVEPRPSSMGGRGA